MSWFGLHKALYVVPVFALGLACGIAGGQILAQWRLTTDIVLRLDTGQVVERISIARTVVREEVMPIRFNALRVINASSGEYLLRRYRRAENSSYVPLHEYSLHDAVLDFNRLLANRPIGEAEELKREFLDILVRKGAKDAAEYVADFRRRVPPPPWFY